MFIVNQQNDVTAHFRTHLTHGETSLGEIALFLTSCNYLYLTIAEAQKLKSVLSNAIDEALKASLTLAEQCAHIYATNRDGQASVFAFIGKMHPNLPWEYCGPCESESPTDNGACLVCGTSGVSA